MENQFSEIPSALYSKGNEGNTILNSIVCFFMTGFCLGMVFFYLSDKSFAKEAGLFDAACMELLQEFTPYRTGLLQYVIVRRLKQLALLLLCAACRLRSLLLPLCIGLMGFLFSLLLFTSMYRYRLLGLLFCLILFMPQWIFYGALFYKILYKCKQSDTKYYHKLNRITQLQYVIFIILLLSAGILCETYINPIWLKKIANLL